MVVSSVLFSTRVCLKNRERRRVSFLEEVGRSGVIISGWDFEVAGAFERGYEITRVLRRKGYCLPFGIDFCGEELSEEWVLRNRLYEWQGDSCFVGDTGHTAEERDNIAAEGGEGRVGIARESYDAFPEGEWLTWALCNSVEERVTTKRFEGRAHEVFSAF